MGRGENDRATEVHRATGEIMTKMGSMARIRIFGFLRGRVRKENKDYAYLGIPY